jgi:hypothetical protein
MMKKGIDQRRLAKAVNSAMRPQGVPGGGAGQSGEVSRRQSSE